MQKNQLSSKDYIEITHPRFIVDLMYARKDNITGCDAYQKIGFGNKAYVHLELWNKLKNIIPYLEETNQYLKIFDAYRPPLAHQMMIDLVPIPNFFAAQPERSPHCRAIAIDVCLCNEHQQEDKYPTEVDAYTPYFAEQIQQGKMTEFQEHLKKATHTFEDSTFSTEIANRKKLQKLMESVGLKSLAHEWWHYNLVDREFYQNFPLVSFGN
ncbi:MAG: M15 family metallopeptidase [Alphaproteobacteria bacterium]|nr:M15 family metallopeptidase [Alphaproteobacteria bacterium]